jgi:hypothetical protein
MNNMNNVDKHSRQAHGDGPTRELARHEVGLVETKQNGEMCKCQTRKESMCITKQGGKKRTRQIDEKAQFA